MSPEMIIAKLVVLSCSGLTVALRGTSIEYIKRPLWYFKDLLYCTGLTTSPTEVVLVPFSLKRKGRKSLFFTSSTTVVLLPGLYLLLENICSWKLKAEAILESPGLSTRSKKCLSLCVERTLLESQLAEKQVFMAW